MISEIALYLSQNGLAIGLAFLLWLVLFDEKALDRLKKAKMVKLMYLPLLAFLLQIVVGIIRIVRKY